MSEMISFGGGVNSTAMTILLVNEGWRGPIVFADTGGEWPETYCYMDYFEKEFLEPEGLSITKLQPGSQWHRSRAQVALEQYCLETGIIPLAFMRWCTEGWKIVPLLNWGRENGSDDMLIAFAVNEARRVKDRPYRHYPLVDRGIDRNGCKHIISKEGLELPRRSACFFCPFQKTSSWRDLWTLHPDLFERAAEMERNASRHCKKRVTLTPSGRFTLDEFRRRLEAQMELPGFEYEYLREFQGCMCGL